MGTCGVGKETNGFAGEHCHLPIFTSGALKVETSLLAAQVDSRWPMGDISFDFSYVFIYLTIVTNSALPSSVLAILEFAVLLSL